MHRPVGPEFLLETLDEELSGRRSRSLDWHAHGAIPDQVGQYAQRTRYTEEYRVEIVLSEAVVHQQLSAVRIDIRPRVLDLTE